MDKELRENLIKAIASGDITLIKSEAQSIALANNSEQEGFRIVRANSFYDLLRFTSEKPEADDKVHVIVSPELMAWVNEMLEKSNSVK
jgi:hypothetical protein